MKPTRFAFTIYLIIFAFACFAFSQDNSKKKDKNIILKPVEVKTNLMVLTSEDKLDDSVKIEDIKIFEDGIEQKITYFALKPAVLNVGLVFDNSGSMKKSLNEIIDAGKVIVANLNSDDQAFAVRFTDSDKIEIIQDWTSDKSELNEALDNLFIEGGPTALFDAIYLSAEKIIEREKTDKSKRYALVLFSDAEERDSYYKLDEVVKLFKETELQIFLLSYAEMAPLKKKTARKLTNLIPFEIGGASYLLPRKRTKEEFLNAIKAIVTELHSNYTIKYISTNQNRDGSPRKLTIQIADNAKGEKRRGIIRESFIVPKN